MEPVINLMVARVVQFSHTQYDKDGMFLEFLVDELRPIILEDGIAIDIFSHQLYEIVPMVDGIIAIDTLGKLSREQLYAYTVYQATFPDHLLPTFFQKAIETYRWYHEEYDNPENSGGGNKIISFSEAKKKLLGKRRK